MNYLYNIFKHPEVMWSGFGVSIIVLIISFLIFMLKYLFKYVSTHTIIEKNKYEKLIKIEKNFVDIDELKKGLEFVNEFGIYTNSETDEKFCPTCLTNRKLLNHLTEEITEFGMVYHCHVCPQDFRDKEFYQKMKQEKKKIRQENADRIKNYIEW